MEKVLYVIRGSSGLEAGAARVELAERLDAAGALGVQVNVADDAVTAAAGLRIATSAAPAATMVSVWLDRATDDQRAPVDEVLAEAVGRDDFAAYLVTESVPLTDDRPVGAGERTRGFAQLAFIQRSPGLTQGEFLDLWLGSHTQIALDLQGTFIYVQNLVARVLTPGATPWQAIVEECFPAAAMTDPHTFFDAVGDDDRLARHQREMFGSVQRFIDLTKIDVIPTSRYVMAV